MDGPDRGGAGAGPPEALIRAWSSALHGVCFVAMNQAERHALLAGLAGRLAAALRAEPFDRAAGQQVGAALVAAGYTAPEVLSRTVTLLHTRLLPDLGLAGAAAEARRAALVEAVTAGFARALRDQTLDDQEQVRAAAAIARNLAERALRDSEARQRYAALHDPLTDLPNQTSLMERLRQVFTDPPAGARVGVCCIDLDRFESINDSLGPPVGDRLLVAVADRLRELAADCGHLVVRRNSDQFAILAEDTGSAEDVTKLADRVLSALAVPFQFPPDRAAGPRGEHELSISASAGVVERAVEGTTPTELMRAADIALHWAKADGRDRWTLYDERRSEREVARHRLSAQMPAALRRGEFTLAYQPLVDLAADQVVGVEALARWRHPRYGVLGADEFVELAEDTGLIVPLGVRLLEQACQQAARWRDRRTGPAPYVSVNLSPRQLQRPGLVGEITEVLDRTGLPPARLQLEITESAVLVTDAQTVGTLETLAGRGVRIAIDDLGTGYSNFAYLYDLPVHGMKLAAELLRDVGRPRAASRAGQVVLTALVSLGRALGLTVTAEGVETAAQAQRLRALGCHVGQGWHFGRPVPADRLAPLLRRRP